MKRALYNFSTGLANGYSICCVVYYAFWYNPRWHLNYNYKGIPHASHVLCPIHHFFALKQYYRCTRCIQEMYYKGCITHPLHVVVERE